MDGTALDRVSSAIGFEGDSRRLACADCPLCAAKAVSSSAYLPPPVACERLAQIVKEQGGVTQQTSPAQRLVYALPSHGSPEVREFFRLTQSVHFDPDYVAQLPGGRVFGSGIVLSPDGRKIARDVSVDFGRSFHEHWLLGYQKIRPPLSVGGRTAVIATALGTGYSHWLLEELPRLLALRGASFDHLITHAGAPFSDVAFHHFGLKANVVHARRFGHFACEELIVPSLVGQAGNPTRAVVELVNDFTARFFGEVARSTPERIYISRQKARRRRVLNEAAIWERLQSLGFVRVYAEDLSWSEQLALFRGAKVVVASHGAGLANLVVCRSGTRVVELFSRNYVNGCYWRLSAVNNLDYRPVVAQGSAALASDLKANRMDFSVDLAALEHALSE